MNAENLMHAIGGISDRYVAEFAEVRPVTPKRCSCLLYTSSRIPVSSQKPRFSPNWMSRSGVVMLIKCRFVSQPVKFFV